MESPIEQPKPVRSRRPCRFNTILSYVLGIGISLLLLTNGPALAQGTSRNLLLYEPDKNAYTVVEKPPKFPGGAEALGRYIQRNLHYPEAAKFANVSGKVYVQFIIRKDGQITDVDILKKLGFGCDEEAIRLVKSMPAWKAGIQSGQPQNVICHLAIPFSLDP